MLSRRSHRALRAAAALWVALGFAPSVVALIHHPAPTTSVLQMNLCNSGWAGCYTGRSVPEAAAMIRAERPDVVTLNEICRDDLVAMAGPDEVASFQPVVDRRVGLPIRCRDGEPYGISLLVRGSGAPAWGGIYPIQEPGSAEGRAWLCAAAAGFTACTTHLVSANPLIALAQCRYLFAVVVPATRRTIDMRKTTDHPALLVVQSWQVSRRPGSHAAQGTQVRAAGNTSSRSAGMG
jgi:hypothetical protein